MQQFDLFSLALTFFGSIFSIGAIWLGIELLTNKNSYLTPVYRNTWYFWVDILLQKFLPKKLYKSSRTVIRLVTGIAFIIFGVLFLCGVLLLLMATFFSRR